MEEANTNNLNSHLTFQTKRYTLEIPLGGVPDVFFYDTRSEYESFSIFHTQDLSQ